MGVYMLTLPITLTDIIFSGKKIPITVITFAQYCTDSAYLKRNYGFLKKFCFFFAFPETAQTTYWFSFECPSY